MRVLVVSTVSTPLFSVKEFSTASAPSFAAPFMALCQSSLRLCLQRPTLRMRATSHLSRESQEAMQMMSEMRKAHLQEVRLLQRGLAARGNGEMRNKVNEVADLVDKLGRAVLQRDENLREKSKAQVRLNKVETDLRALTDECTRLKRHNKSLNDQLKEANRRAKFTPPRPDADAPEDSDEEFEHELLAFEQRFTILEEGPAGLDILASNLSKDKQNLEKRLKQSQETVQSLTNSVEEWKRLSEEQDLQIADLSAKLDQMMRDHAALQEAITQKRREIEQQVAEEKALLEAKVQELQMECDNARAVADGMDKASSRVQKDVLGKSAQPAESRFYELLQHEMSKVNRFFQLQLRTLLDWIVVWVLNMTKTSNISWYQATGSELLTHANRLLEEAADGLVELDQFKYLNFTGFRKIAKKFDKSTKSTLVKSFQLVLPPHQGHVASEGMSGEELSSELQKLLYALGTEGLHVPCRIATQMTAETWLQW
eukprot:g30108.t1